MKKIIIKKETFNCFDVYEYKEGNCFVYANVSNKDAFIDGIIDFIFNENNLLNYANRLNKIEFVGTEKNFNKLYSNISVFLNRELELLSLGADDAGDKALLNVITQEYGVIKDSSGIKVQNDKIGKIGEYIFHIFLTDYFQLDCILPKFKCTTDRNMSVFGIDALFFDDKNKILYFGESKFCKNIDNGIQLINRSLKYYESQVDEEYRIVLSNKETFALCNSFIELFSESIDYSISFKSFIKKASLSQIGIPVFIAHGNNFISDQGVCHEEYINKMIRGIKQKKLFNIDTKYIFISLPVIDKETFITRAINKVMQKQNGYKNKRV